MDAPRFDTRTEAEVFATALDRARVLTPEWAQGFGAHVGAGRTSDPGLALLHLFAQMHGQIAGPLNAVSDKYRLAFWDFAGITLRPPQAAEAPLWFQLSGKAPVTVPAGTRVVSTTEKSVVFETAEDLRVLPARIAAAYALRPEADAFADRSAQVSGGVPFPLFADSADQQPVPHALFLDDPALSHATPGTQLTVSLSGANLGAAFFGQWQDATGAPLQPVATEENFGAFTARFVLEAALPAGQVDGVTGTWLRVAPAPGQRILPFLARALPRLSACTLRLDLPGAPADAAFCNAISLDLKKGANPLGRKPAVDDAFYLASSAAFSTAGATVTLTLSLQPVDPPEAVTLAWEYWNGAAWAAMAVTDTTVNLTRSGTVSFTCPEIVKSKVNQQDNYWIRARIAEGGYGAPQGRMVTLSAAQVVGGVLAPFLAQPQEALEALKASDIDFGYEFKPADFAPPFIHRLAIATTVIVSPERQVTRNGWDYARLDGRPYRPETPGPGAFYIGFAPDGFAAHVLGADLSLYLAFRNEDPTLLPASGTGGDAQALRFEYATPEGDWQPIDAVRTPGATRNEGILTLGIPAAMRPATVFGQRLYWLRVLPPEADAARLSRVCGIYPNAVPAFNVQTWRGVVLGSSTGAPDQSFAFPHRPVLEGTRIEVLQTVPAPGGPAGADLVQEWVAWEEVSNFDFATPQSRCYVIDHEAGRLTFGDGVRGAVPPAGARNIRAALYRSGGGTAGNRPAGDLATLKTAIPAIASVRNVEAAVGGVDADTVAELPRRAPGELRAMGRGVTLADIAALAVASSQQVVRAAVEEDGAGAADLVVLPAYEGATPLPSFDLRSAVGAYLGDRCQPQVSRAIRVGGPDYVAVPVAVAAILSPGANRDQVYQALSVALGAFLMPLTGGADGAGWTFGATLRASDVASVLGGVPGVALIDGLTLAQDRSFLAFGWNQLPTAGALRLEVVDADTL